MKFTMPLGRRPEESESNLATVKGAEAEHLLKLKTAESDLEAATAVLKSDQEALSKLEAERASLPHDDGAIVAHLQKEAVAKLRVEIAQRAFERGQSAKESIGAAVERLAFETRYAHLQKLRQEHLSKFFTEYAPTATKLKDLLVAANVLDVECIEFNKSLLNGAKPLGAAFGFERTQPPARLEVRLLDARGSVLWAGYEDSDPTGSAR